jgi:hypothetical protein
LSGEVNNTNELTPVTEPPPPPPRPLPLTLDSPDSEQVAKHSKISQREKELYDWLSSLGLIKYFTLFFREEVSGHDCTACIDASILSSGSMSCRC